MSTNYNVRLTSDSDLEMFAEYVREAVCQAFPEDFGRVRLQEAKMKYAEFSHVEARGYAYDDSLVVKQTENALQLAGTIVHELAHVLVGPKHMHDGLWTKAAQALGLQFVQSESQDYKPEHFSSGLLRAIEDCLKKLSDEHPEIVYSADIPIPVPPYVGMPDCPDQREDCDFGHKVHIMQFQLDGVRWMLANNKPGLLYADDPGLGKTVGFMLYVNATHPKSLLVICPNNVKLVWYEHFQFYCVHKDILENLEVAHSNLWTFSPITVMSYEAARRYKDALARMDWDLVAFDEMHYLKTPGSARSKACYGIRRWKKAIGITGTPVVNYINEAFPLIHYLDEPNWPEFGRFASRYMVQGDRFGKNLGEFNAKLRATIMLRRFKKDVMSELPQKRRQMIQFEVDDSIRELIEEEKRLWEEVTKSQTDSEMVKMLNAMKNESDTAIDDVDWAKIIEELKFTKRYAFERMAIIAHSIGLAKVPLAIEFITNALENKEKVAIFGHHRDVLSKLADHFKPNSVLLLGGTSNQAEATAMAASRFANDPDCNVFVGGISLAAGYSLKGTSTVIFVEEDWVPGIMTQAEDRCHGIGRGERDATSLMIYHLCFEDSLDTHKAKKTIRKQKAIDRATGKV